MNGFALFTDASVDPRLREGIGGYLLLPDSCLSSAPGDIDSPAITEGLVLKRFEETTSTRLEVQVSLWALRECRGKLKGRKLTLYTDSQCLRGLGKRRRALESKAFLSGKTHLPLKNAALYREFFTLADELGFEVVKVAGHTRALSRNTVEQIFTLLDKAVRKALRNRE